MSVVGFTYSIYSRYTRKRAVGRWPPTLSLSRAVSRLAPHNVVKRWLISDEEAKNESIEWHGLDDGCSEAESEEDEQVGAAQPRLPRTDGGLRGTVKSGRWQPAGALCAGLCAVEAVATTNVATSAPPEAAGRSGTVRRPTANLSRRSARRRRSMCAARASPRASASAASAALAAICSPHNPQISSA